MAALDPASVRLSSNTTVARYRALEASQDRQAIAAFLRERFTERYLAPLSSVDPTKKHGFTIMAVSCLMIEALESFRRGWPHTSRRSELAFCSFFSWWPQFSMFSPHSAEFFKHIRCGILHQAETTGGWRILRSGSLLDPASRTINATAFLTALARVLDSYCSQLGDSPWDDEPWQCLRRKMMAVCKNALG